MLRVGKELIALRAWCAEHGLALAMLGDDSPTALPLAFTVQFRGPVGTPYEGGLFVVRCGLPAKYPVKPPSMVFLTRIWHANIHPETGGVCMDALKEGWAPASMTIVSLFEQYLPMLLHNPNCSDPYNFAAAEQLTTAPSKYAKFAAEHTAAYAKVSGASSAVSAVATTTASASSGPSSSSLSAAL